MQCTSNAYIAIIFSAIKDINIWKSDELDYILNEGDRIFNLVGLKKPLSVDELLLDISLEGFNISVNLLAHESGVFMGEKNLFENIRQKSGKNQGNRVIFTCGGFSVVVIWSQDSAFPHDFHSRNEGGFHDPNRHVVLLKFDSIISLNNYIKTFCENSSNILLDTTVRFGVN